PGGLLEVADGNIHAANASNRRHGSTLPPAIRLVARTQRYQPVCQPQTSLAISEIMRSLVHCSSSERILPSSVDANPHCGDRQRRSIFMNLEAASLPPFIASRSSNCPNFVVTSPRTTVLSLGARRNGSKPPALSVSNSMK